MKKLLIIALASIVLSGCATHTGTAILVGSTVGYVIGTAVRVDRPNMCDQYSGHHERAACNRGLQRREQEEQRRRENDAYRAGYGR